MAEAPEAPDINSWRGGAAPINANGRRHEKGGAATRSGYGVAAGGGRPLPAEVP
jgi:hypothetical protein